MVGELSGGSGGAGGDGLVGENYRFAFEACVCEVGRLGACFTHFELGFFEVLFLVALFFGAGAHGILWYKAESWGPFAVGMTITRST